MMMIIILIMMMMLMVGYRDHWWWGSSSSLIWMYWNPLGKPVNPCQLVPLPTGASNRPVGCPLILAVTNWTYKNSFRFQENTHVICDICEELMVSGFKLAFKSTKPFTILKSTNPSLTILKTIHQVTVSPFNDDSLSALPTLVSPCTSSVDLKDTWSTTTVQREAMTPGWPAGDNPTEPRKHQLLGVDRLQLLTNLLLLRLRIWSSLIH